MGSVLITGDLAHFRENYDTNGVPTFNTDRAQTLASFDRFHPGCAGDRRRCRLGGPTSDAERLRSAGWARRPISPKLLPFSFLLVPHSSLAKFSMSEWTDIAVPMR